MIGGLKYEGKPVKTSRCVTPSPCSASCARIAIRDSIEPSGKSPGLHASMIHRQLFHLTVSIDKESSGNQPAYRTAPPSLAIFGSVANHYDPPAKTCLFVALDHGPHSGAGLYRPDRKVSGLRRFVHQVSQTGFVARNHRFYMLLVGRDPHLTQLSRVGVCLTFVWPGNDLIPDSLRKPLG